MLDDGGRRARIMAAIQQYVPGDPDLAGLLATVGTDRIVIHQATGMIAAQLDKTTSQRARPAARHVGRDSVLARAFVRLADTLASDLDVVDFLQSLSADSVEILGAEAAGVMLADARGGLRLIASSDERMRLLELFELQGAQGPCLDAFASGQAVQANAADSLGRWPVFAPHASDAGFQMMCAVPLRIRTDVIGALNLFRGTNEPFTELHRRTEGWPAGLYLAALYVREGGQVGSAGVSFGGDDQFVSDYVESEFLARISRRQRAWPSCTGKSPARWPSCAAAPRAGACATVCPRKRWSIPSQPATWPPPLAWWRNSGLPPTGKAGSQPSSAGSGGGKTGGIEGHPMAAARAALFFALTGRPVEAERWADVNGGDASFEAAVRAGEQAGAHETLAVTLCERSLVAMTRGQWSRARVLSDQARTVLRRAGIDESYAKPQLAVRARIELTRVHLALADVAGHGNQRLMTGPPPLAFSGHGSPGRGI